MQLRDHPDYPMNFRQLEDALLDALRSDADIEAAVLHAKIIKKSDIPVGDTPRDRMHKLIDSVDSRGGVDRLVVGAFSVNPGNPLLIKFAIENTISYNPSAVSLNDKPQIRYTNLIDPSVKDFTGRLQEIDEIISKLAEADKKEDAKAKIAQEKKRSFKTSGSVVIINGMGGVGKTQLAYAVAHQLAQQYPDGLVEVNLGGPDINIIPSESILLIILQKLLKLWNRPSTLLLSSSDSLKDDYRSLLHEKRVLIVADNAQDYTQVKPLTLLPLGCGLIVTSLPAINHPGSILIKLDPLPHSDAEEMLYQICERIGKDASELARLCGYLPLALRIAANRLRVDPSFPVKEYLKNLANEPLEQLIDPDDADLIVEASIKLSWDVLVPIARNVLTQLSVFPTDFDFTAAQGIVHLPKGTPKLRDVFTELTRYSLLNWEASTDQYNVHDLVRAFARKQLKLKSNLSLANNTYLRYAQYYVQLAENLELIYRKSGDASIAESLPDRERPHLNAAWNWLLLAKRNAKTDKLVLRFAASSIYTEILSNTDRKQRTQQWETILRIAKERGDRPSQIIAWGGLADSYVDLSKSNDAARLRQAIPYFEEQIELARAIDDQGKEADTSWNLSRALEALDSASIAELEHAINLASVYFDYNKDQIAKQDKDRVAELQARIAVLRAGPKPESVPEPTLSQLFDPGDESE